MPVCVFCRVLQWGVLVNDTSGSGGGRTATLSLHQLLSGGRTSLAAEYTLPLNGELLGPLHLWHLHDQQITRV
jgi:hypothetical protein